MGLPLASRPLAAPEPLQRLSCQAVAKELPQNPELEKVVILQNWKNTRKSVSRQAEVVKELSENPNLENPIKLRAEYLGFVGFGTVSDFRQRNGVGAKRQTVTDHLKEMPEMASLPKPAKVRSEYLEELCRQFLGTASTKVRAEYLSGQVGDLSDLGQCPISDKVLESFEETETSERVVRGATEKSSLLADLQKLRKLRAEYLEEDWQAPLFNIWSFSKKTNEASHC